MTKKERDPEAAFPKKPDSDSVAATPDGEDPDHEITDEAVQAATKRIAKSGPRGPNYRG